MPRQLFDEVRVSRRGGGAVPFSMAVHAAVVGTLLVIGGNRVAETQTEPPRTPVVLARELPAAAGPKQEQPPKTAPKIATRKTRPSTITPPVVAQATPPPLVAPDTVPEGVTQDDPGPEIDTPASGGVYCPTCLEDAGAAVGTTDGAVPTGDGEGSGPIRLSELEAPAKIRHVLPIYPPLAVHAKLEGDVRIDCTIGPDGRVRDARVLEGPILLRDAALAAVRQWVYSPPRLSGQPVSVLLAVTVRFRLR
jgi:TonB family protein